MSNNYVYIRIDNKESEIFIELLDRLLKEKQLMEWQNKKLEAIIPYKWHRFCGRPYQCTCNRLPIYNSFKFECRKEEIDSKAWREDRECDGYFTPNRRTRKGKAIGLQLDELNNKQNILYDWFYPLLGVEQMVGKFQFPFMFYVEGKIYLSMCIDLRSWREHEGITEITLSEFIKVFRDAQKRGIANDFTTI